MLKESEAYKKGGVVRPGEDDLVSSNRETEDYSRGLYRTKGNRGDDLGSIRGQLGSDRIMEYEAKLNRDFFPKYPCKALCQCGQNRFHPNIIMDVLRTHPKVIMGGKFTIEWCSVGHTSRKLCWKMIGHLRVSRTVCC